MAPPDMCATVWPEPAGPHLPFSLLAGNHGLTINSGNAGRYDVDGVLGYCAALKDEIDRRTRERRQPLRAQPGSAHGAGREHTRPAGVRHPRPLQHLRHRGERWTVAPGRPRPRRRAVVGAVIRPLNRTVLESRPLPHSTEQTVLSRWRSLRVAVLTTSVACVMAAPAVGSESGAGAAIRGSATGT